MIRWVFDPTKLGRTVDGPYEPYFTPGQMLFQLPSGTTPVKMVGFNMVDDDHLKSQDLAIVYLSETYNVPQVAVWNHASNTLQSFEAGGRTLVDAICDDFDADGREDIAVLTRDIASNHYYLTVLLTQADGSVQILRHEGADVAVATDGTSLTNLASIRVFGGQKAILWNTRDGDSYVNAALVTNGQIRITTEKIAFAGNIVALSAGDVGTSARFAIYAPGTTSGHVIGTFVGSITVGVDGKFSVDSELTKYGGTFSGYDIGVTGAPAVVSTATSGIVFNDANSNGFQDPGETGLPGITLRLATPGGSIVTTTSSDGSDGSAVGSYRFDQVAPDAFIQIALPSGSWLAQNPPQGVDTNSNGADGLLVGVAFTGGASLQTLPFDAPTDNPYSISVKSGDLQNKGRANLVIRTADSLYVQYFGVDGSNSFTRFDVGSPAGYFKPELELADLNRDGRIDIVTSGQSGVDVFINIGFGQFTPYLGVLADLLNNTPNGSYFVKGAFTGDLDSGVTAAKTYTHALNFNGPATTVNGVLFATAGPTGTNYNLQSIDPATQVAGTLGAFGNFNNNLVGAMNTLASDFYYSFGDSLGGERLTLTGLTTGVTYTTTFYSVGFGTGQRQQIVFDSLGGSVKLDEDSTGSGNGFMFSRTFTATSDSITFTFVAQDSNSFHHYALTNEIAPVGFTTAQPLTGDNDTPINSGHHYTHALDFAGDQAVNVSGVPFAQAAPQGSNYSLVAYDPVSQTTSPGMNVLTGYNNALTGGLNSAVSNLYSSPTGSSQLKLTGLLVGATYTTTFYGIGFGSGVARVSRITDSLGGSIVIDENLFGDRQGFQFSRTFVATGDSITYTFVALDPANGFLHYAITNQLVDDRSNYAIELLPGDAGSEVSSSKTYTHSIDFNGAGNVVVNGVPFSQTAASGANYSLTAINPVDLTESSMQAVTGFANSLAGQFNSAASNYYFSPTGASKLTLSGLTAGVTYTATFYMVGDGTAGARHQSIADSLGGSYYVDQNLEGNGRGIRITRTYVATSDTMVFWFMGDNANAGFNHYAMTNEVTALEPGSPAVYSTEIAIVPGDASGKPDRILAVQQNTGIVYEIALNGSAAPAATGNVFATDHAIIKMDVGDVSAVGANDLVIYETRSSDPSDPITSPIAIGLQQVWVLAASSNYATGTLAMDLGSFTYQPRVDLAIAPLFAGSESIVFLGNRIASQTMDVLMSRSGSSIQKTSKAGFVGYGLNFGQFIANNSVPNVVVAGENAITVLVPGNDPSDVENPNGFDPNVPLIEADTTITGSTIAAAIGIQTGAHYDELMVVQYVEGSGYVVQPYFNTTDSYQAGSDVDGALYDFAVVVPGSGGGVIGGNVFYDAAGNGLWDPIDYGVYDGVTIYLDLNNNGQFDPTEQSTTPDLDGNYRFSHLLPKVYTVAIQLGAGYNATSPVSTQVVVSFLPRAATYGVDFGVQAKNFGVDFNNDKQADMLLTDPTSNGVYVQLRNGLNRLSTYKIGDLSSADWSVVGLYDLTANGTTDVLLHNVHTGQLQVWDLFPGNGIPVVARKHTLDYFVPANFAVAGVGDLNHDGTPDIVLDHNFTGEHRLVQIAGNAASESRLPIANSMQVVGVGDLDGDGDTDLVLQPRGSDGLFADVYENGRFLTEKSLGTVHPAWAVAGVTDLIFGGPSEVLFQDRSTGTGYAWTLTSQLAVEQSVEVDIGSHSGLLLHLSDRHTLTQSALRIQGFAGTADENYQENGSPLVIGGVGTIIDRQHAGFQGSTLTVWLRVNGTEDDRLSIKHSGNAPGKIGVDIDTRIIRYGGIAIASYVGGVGVDSLVITFTAAATEDSVQAVLKAITFANVSDNPLVPRRVVSLAFTDGEGRVSNIASRSVRINPANDRPVLTVSGSTVQYTEGGAPAIIDSNIEVLDVDSRNFAGGVLTIRIASGGQTSDRLGIRASGLIGIDETARTVSYGGKRIGTYVGTTTLAITLNGNATAQIIQDLVRHITFSTISDAPSSTPRQIKFTLSDGDGGLSAVASGDIVLVTPTNDPPVLAFQNSVRSLRYRENQGQRTLGNDALLTDPDSSDFAGGVLTVSFASGGDEYDRLEIRDRSGIPDRIGVSGADVTFNDIVIGSFSGGVGTTPLSVSFNSMATLPIVQALLRSLTFRTLGDAPSTATRAIEFVLTDGDGATSNIATKTVTVKALNDRPILALGGTINYAENQPARILATKTAVTDSDSLDFDGGSLTVRVTNNSSVKDRLEIANQGTAPGQIGIAGIMVTYGGITIGTFSGGNGNQALLVSLNANATPMAVHALTRAITFRTLGENPSTLQRTITWQVNDGDGAPSLFATKFVNVTAVNDPPVLAGTTTALGYTRGAAAIAISNNFTTTEPDSSNFANGRLLAKFDSPADAANRLEVSGAFTFSGTTLNYFNGTSTIAIGTRNTNGGIGIQLSIRFNANATLPITQHLLRSLRFRTVGTANATQRVVSLNITDGDGGISNTLTRAINVM